MFRISLNRAFRNRLGAVAVWAMVPVALWNGRADGGCICADGHFEPVCKAAHCPSGLQGAQVRPVQNGSCGCSCCKNVEARRGNAELCRTKRGCCEKSGTHDANDHAGKSVGGEGCCTPVAQAQAVATVVPTPRIDDHQHSSALVAILQDSPGVLGAVRATRLVDVDTGPPTNLVITLRRLVI